MEENKDSENKINARKKMVMERTKFKFLSANITKVGILDLLLESQNFFIRVNLPHIAISITGNINDKDIRNSSMIELGLKDQSIYV